MARIPDMVVTVKNAVAGEEIRIGDPVYIDGSGVLRICDHEEAARRLAAPPDRFATRRPTLAHLKEMAEKLPGAVNDAPPTLNGYPMVFTHSTNPQPTLTFYGFQRDGTIDTLEERIRRYRQKIMTGEKTINQVRKEEGLSPLSSLGDVRYIPSVIEAMSKIDQETLRMCVDYPYLVPLQTGPTIADPEDADETLDEPDPSIEARAE